MESWIITTRHLDSRSPHGRQPVGERHARPGDDARTACGQFTQGWPVFWYLPFDARDPESCPRCSSAVRGISQPSLDT